MMAIAYGNVYVAQVAMGANNEQAVIAFREAEAHDGPSLILAYSQCIAHGTDMRHGMKQAARAVASGHWPLLRFDPTMRSRGMNPFRLDSTRPRISLEEYRNREVRFKVLAADPSERSATHAATGAARGRRALQAVRGPGRARRQPVPSALGERCDHGSCRPRTSDCELAHPIIASASPLTSTVDGIRALEDAGAAAVVMASLFEEQVRAEDTAYAMYTEHGSYSQPEAGSYFPRCPTTTAVCRAISIRCGARWPQSTSR